MVQIYSHIHDEDNLYYLMVICFKTQKVYDMDSFLIEEVLPKRKTNIHQVVTLYFDKIRLFV